MESDLHRKIILHQDVLIQDSGQPSLENLNESGLVLLKLHDEIVTITPVMREILEVVRAPHTPDELIQWMAEAWGYSYESIYQPICSFLKRMGRLGILVYEENQHGCPSILEELDQIKCFAGFTLSNRMSRTHKVALYKCTLDKRDTSYYALKILLTRHPQESVQREFFKEFEILRSLDEHKNIRNCLYASVNYGIPYLLFEYVEGESMSKKVGKISLESKTGIAYQLMEAINHLHLHRILHGDIHASNFLIDPENGLHLIDLGMAHFEDEDEENHGGVPRYMPPERMPDHPLDFSIKKGDYQSEIFQIGVCLYLLFSGQYPFRGLLLKNLANSIKYEAAPPLIKTPLGEKIPTLLTHVISKSMEKDPSRRYASVADMMDAWEQAIHHYEPILM
jgi:serine/threonine protein kinase